MKKRLFSKGLFLMLGLLLSWSISSNAQCTYTLSLDDTFGDGWNGNTIDVTVDTVTTNYTLGAGLSNQIINLSVNTGDSIILNYLAGGAFNGEVSFTLLDPSGGTVYASGTGPFTGIHSSVAANCPSCSPPVNFNVTSLTDVSAQLNWTEQSAATQWEVEYDTAGFVLGTGNRMLVSNDTFLIISGLTQQTDYDWYVRTICAPMDSSSFAGANSFTTPCSAFPAPFAEDFTTFLPSACWQEADAGSPATGPMNFGSGSWGFNGGNGNGAFRSNIFTTGKSDWVVSPTIDFGAGGYELALTVLGYDFGAAPGTFAGMGSDDTVQVVISDNGGLTWTAVQTWDATNPPSSTAVTAAIDLTAYTGSNNIIGIWVSEGATNDPEDYYFEVERFELRIPPTCSAPTPNAVGSITDSSATVTWIENGTATEWEVEWDTAGYTTGAARNSMIVMNDTFLTVTGLMSQTDYDWNVRAICGPMDTSGFVGGSFTTNCSSFPAPFVEPFTAFLPNICWQEADAGDITTGPMNFGGGSWGANFGNTNGAFRSNLFTTGKSDWVISPIIDFGAGGYELAITVLGFDFGSAPGTFAGMGSDDTVQVVVSSDGGLTWKAEYTWDAANPPSSTAAVQRVDLTALTGSNHLVAIYCTEGTVNDPEDYWFEVENFELRVPPLCPAPTANSATAIGTDSAIVSWIENGTAAEYEVEWDVASFTPGTASNSMIVITDTFLTITGLSASTTYEWNVRAICGRGDTSTFVGNSFNTLIQGPVGVNCVGATNPSVVYSDDLETMTGWTGDIGTGNGSFNYNTGVTGSFATGPTAAQSGTQYVYFEASGAGGGDSANFISPAIDLTQGSNSAELSFWLHAYGADIGTLEVGVGTSATGPFTNLFSSTGQIQTANADPWQNVGVNLDAFVGQVIYIEFNYFNGASFNGDLSIDLIEVSSCISCAIPSNLTASAGLDTASVDWTENGTATSWEISYGTRGTAAGMGTQTVTSMKPFNITGLTPSTSYDFFVRAICAAGDTSAWSPVGLFSTANGIPYAEDFETFPSGSNIATNGWTNSQGTTAPDWTADNGGTGSFATGPDVDHTLGTAAGIYLYLETSGGTQGDTDTLSSSPILVGAMQDSLTYSYWYHMAGATMGDLQVWVESNGVWDSLTTYSGPQHATTSDPWLLGCHRLNGYAGQNITLRFLGVRGSSFSGDMAIDDISIIETLPCMAPIAAAATNVGLDSADVMWVGAGAGSSVAKSYIIEWDVTGFTPGSGSNSMIVSGADSTTLRGLSASTTYDYNVRAICAPGDTSAASNTVSFTTLMAPIPFYPIGTINTEDSMGVADSSGVNCSISGTVVGVDKRGGGYDFVLIDMSSGSQEGITVFAFNDLANYTTPTEGDSLFITGNVSQFRGLTQFSPDTITLISAGNAIPAPIVVTTLDESTESKWLSIPTSYVSLGTSGTGSFNLDLTNGTDTITIRVDSDTDIDDSLAVNMPIVPGDTICGMFGTGGQFNNPNAAPFNNGYQIFPMRWSDLTICRLAVGIDDVDAVNNTFSIYPNPTTGQFVIETTGFNNASVIITVRDLEGRIVRSEAINNANSALTKSFDLTDNAKGVYFITIQDGENLINQKLVIQ